MAKVLTLASAKGGAGKSTLAAMLGSVWHLQGRRVLMVDADPQESLRDWGATAAVEGVDGPAVVGMGDDISARLSVVASPFEVVIIDTPGRRSRRMAAALGVSDLALIPVQAGATDIWAAGQTMEVVEQARAIRGGLPEARLVTNRINMRTLVGRSAPDTLEGLGVPLMCSGLGDRVAFVEAMAAGQGVTSYAPSSRAAKELGAVAAELASLLELENQEILISGNQGAAYA